MSLNYSMHFPFSILSPCKFIFRRLAHSLHAIPSQQRKRAILEAQQALTEYLHSTRCLSFAHAEYISKNCPCSLSNLLSKFKFSAANVSRTVHRFLRYHPINEFEFFFESIGLTQPETLDLLPPHKLFLSEVSGNLLTGVSTLIEFSFPWDKLGRIYKEEVSVFNESPRGLIERLHGLEALGFDRASLVGICLAFPFVLVQNAESERQVVELLDALKRIFHDFNFAGRIDGSINICYQICQNIKIFYNLGCEMRVFRELIGENYDVFVEFTEDDFVRKVDFFCRLGMRKTDIGLLILKHPEILKFNLDGSVINVTDYLIKIGLGSEKLNEIIQRYSHVLGKNRLENLPETMKALDVHNWFADKVMNGNHHLLCGFVGSYSSEELELDFRDDIERMNFSTKRHHTFGKMDFLLGIGFGNNLNTVEILRHLHGTRTQLQERFDCLLHMGMKHSTLCKMITSSPKILNQNVDMLTEKVIFFLNELCFPLQHLHAFPSYLYYDLEKRIKPRFRIFSWLRENGLVKKEYSLSTVLVASEKKFISYLFSIHPGVVKQWLEVFSMKDHSKYLS